MLRDRRVGGILYQLGPKAILSPVQSGILSIILPEFRSQWAAMVSGDKGLNLLCDSMQQDDRRITGIQLRDGLGESVVGGKRPAARPNALLNYLFQVVQNTYSPRPLDSS